MKAKLAEEGLRFYLILNAFWEPLDFETPLTNGGAWRRWIDTNLDPPHDIVEWRASSSVYGPTYQAGPRSVVALITGRAFEDDSPFS